jgi:hypothetical protein
MKRHALGLLTLALGSSLLSACGDTGDHFGEFRRTGARVVPVTNVQLAVPQFTGQPGTFPLSITAFEANGHSIPIPNSFTNPIVLTSSATCPATFATSASPSTFASSISVPNTTTLVTVQFACTPTTITAGTIDMGKNTVSITLSGF